MSIQMSGPEPLNQGTKNIFEFEQALFKVWNITEDIEMLYEAAMQESGGLSVDQIANTLLGMKQLYELRFEKLYEHYRKASVNHFSSISQIEELKAKLVDHELDMQRKTPRDKVHVINNLKEHVAEYKPKRKSRSKK
jgi:hypothetical protein